MDIETNLKYLEVKLDRLIRDVNMIKMISSLFLGALIGSWISWIYLLIF